MNKTIEQPPFRNISRIREGYQVKVMRDQTIYQKYFPLGKLVAAVDWRNDLLRRLDGDLDTRHVFA